MNFKKIEEKWQKKWSKEKIFEANVDPKRKKFFITIPYPYVNGAPHIGAAFTFFRGDVYARFKRMQGFNVLYSQAFHATGEPIVGAIERLKQKDPVQIETFKLYGATDRDIKSFIRKGPEFVARYWMQKWIEDLKAGGFSLDWRRTFVTAITPAYSRFIEWQYNTLRSKGYVVQGTHPVIWCPHDQSPTGDHDRLEGEGESPIEYVIIKFQLDSGEVIPTGTLRPETVFGTTNLWINPVLDYVWAKVGNETWLLTEKAVDKLKDQMRDVRKIGKVRGENLVGRNVINPATGDKITILPASFVDPYAGTGIVMSVPSHAPYDWAGLSDLQKDPRQLKRFNIDYQGINQIKPVSVIKTDGFGEHPAVEACIKLQIQNQREKEKLDDATSMVYKKEYHLGVLNENCKEYAGMKVSEVKEKMIQDFVQKGIADKVWEMTGLVICRCNTVCHVKILENQWFLKFSDEEWKERVKQAIEKMKFYPETAKIQFLNTVDWLNDKACTRKSGLGTKLPWDKEWIVETLSDSTIYMAFYTLARVINEKKIKAKKLTDEVFDYIFLGKGDLKEISKRSKLKPKIIQELRDEFVYFYPVDLRNSGKDLMQNHLTFYLFHHTAIWDNPKFWPKSVGVNGYVKVLGTKMSKSRGNIIPLRELIKSYGTDVVRINIVSANENMDDADWREDNLISFTSRFQFLERLIGELKKAKRNKIQNIDLFLQSKVQKAVMSATQNYEEMKFRSATQSGFFNLVNDLKWYLERNSGIKNCNKKILSETLSVIVRLIAPITPHIAEEFWSELGNRKFVSISEWPTSLKSLINENSERNEQLIMNTIEDVKQIQKITGVTPKAIHIIIAPDWKFRVFGLFLKHKNKQLGELIKLSLKEVKAENKDEVAVYVQYLNKKGRELTKEVIEKKKQKQIFDEAKDFLRKQLKSKIIVEEAEKSKLEKAKQADVFKSAIYFA